MEYQDILYAESDGVATITLDRPDRLNALTFEVYRKLTDRLYEMRFEPDVKVVVITGAGKGFCGGGDGCQPAIQAP